MRKLWRKFLCFIGMHSFLSVESNTFGMIMRLSKSQCLHCLKPRYFWGTMRSEIPISQQKYDGMYESMIRVSEVTKGTGAETMTTHTKDE